MTNGSQKARAAEIYQNARLVTLHADTPALANGGPVRGSAWLDIRANGVLPNADLVLDKDKRVIAIREARPSDRTDYKSLGGRVIDCKGRVLMPRFVDCHTHACWAGSRVDEWEQRLAGKSYQEIMAAGGGIMSTVRAVRAESEYRLGYNLHRCLLRMYHTGTGLMEVKTGYGLSTDDELKMLRAIRIGTGNFEVVPTALLGHAIDPDFPGGREAFIRHTIENTLPAVVAAAPGIAIDAFCESGAWTKEECVRLLERAVSLGSPVRVHTDQFSSLGMITEAIRLRARSVDHLEAAAERDLDAVAASDTAAVILPCSGFHLDGRYANGRSLLDRGAALSIATNCNPGSAPCYNMTFAMALAVRHCGLTPLEALVAATRNPAAVLGSSTHGFIAVGRVAHVELFRFRDERELACEVGGNPTLNGDEIDRVDAWHMPPLVPPEYAD